MRFFETLSSYDYIFSSSSRSGELIVLILVRLLVLVHENITANNQELGLSK